MDPSVSVVAENHRIYPSANRESRPYPMAKLWHINDKENKKSYFDKGTP